MSIAISIVGLLVLVIALGLAGGSYRPAESIQLSVAMICGTALAIAGVAL